jgi:DnaJ-domain-containing protein 1
MPTRRFAAQETTVYRDLQNSMKRLGATSLRVGQRDLLNPKDVKAEIQFDRAGKRYVVRCMKWANFLDNLRAAERTIFYLYRAIAEYGAETNAQAFGQAVDQFFAGFEALPDDSVLMLGNGKQHWWDALGVKQEATKAEIISAYRALARVHHPDAGGDATMFKRLREAYEHGLTARGAS